MKKKMELKNVYHPLKSDKPNGIGICVSVFFTFSGCKTSWIINLKCDNLAYTKKKTIVNDLGIIITNYLFVQVTLSKYHATAASNKHNKGRDDGTTK